MERYLCIHGHFYQPPRENPWLEAVEIQDSAYPYHDWNEKVTAECYAPNAVARILDSEGRLVDIVSNYARMSFNFGPTLLSWMEKYCAETYRAILDADRQSMEWRSGHGNAMAQVYNHIIMPLANTRDKRTQVIWGIKDFEYRFRRFPEGMWLAETAVDLETLDILAEQGIKFTLLAPRQASKVRGIGGGAWKDVHGGKIDPARAYLCKLPSGREISIFFYDGPISHGIAFENLLNRGEDFANRLLKGFSHRRNWPQLLNVATDGETYGHHHRFGEMALSYALSYVESKGLARITNYGEYLERHPPAFEVQIHENSSWSCIHGVERWRGNCGCNTGSHREWSQEWRRPLRESLDWLREQLVLGYGHAAAKYVRDPWAARDDYITMVLDRSDDADDAFIGRHAAGTLGRDERVAVLKLLEIQRHAMLMYTSCGWFFDDLSGIETVQVIKYAGRAVQLSQELFSNGTERGFMERLAAAKSNISEYGDGASLYENFVKSSMIDLKKVAVHYAVSSLFEDYDEKTDIYCYEIARETYYKTLAGPAKLALGKIEVRSRILGEAETLAFAVFHLGSHSLYGGVRTFLGDDVFQVMKNEITETFESGAFADIMRLMDTHFGMHTYSLKDLFRDEQRKIIQLVIRSTLEEFESAYRQMYYNSRILMGFLEETGMPIPKAFYAAAEFTLNLDMKAALGEKLDVEQIEEILQQIKKWDIPVDAVELEFAARQRIETMMRELYAKPGDLSLLVTIGRVIALLKQLPVDMNVWETQNLFYKMTRTTYGEMSARAASGDESAGAWTEEFRRLGQVLFFNMDHILR